MEPDQLQAEDQPHWSHRLSEHRHHVTRRLPLRFRRQGRQGSCAWIGLQCCGSGMFIPDPGSWFLPIPDPGSKNRNKREGWKKIDVIPFYVATNFTKLFIILVWSAKEKNLGQFSKNYTIELFTQKIVTILSKVWVWDPGSGKNLFRIPDLGVKKAPDPGSGSATLVNCKKRIHFHKYLFFYCIGGRNDQCFGSVFIWDGSGSSILCWIPIGIQSGSKVLMTKNVIYLLLKKDFQATEEASSALNGEYPALQNMKFLNFSYFFGSFLSSWIRIQISNPDTDLLTWLNPDSKHWERHQGR